MKEIMGWLLALLIPLLIVFTLNMKVFAISGVDQSSMHNTLFEGDVVYFNRLADKVDELKREDIILFLTNGREKQGFWDEVSIKLIDFTDKFRKDRINERYVKRIIGMPGDVIEITPEGDVYVNGEKENKAYVVGKTPPRALSYPVKVPENQFFVMGDNREVSEDSRSFGCISIRSLEGKASMILWPPSKVGTIR
jgi:signal peptidase I